MESWMTLWKVVFVVSVGAFSLMAVWVTIFGALDIKHLLKTLREEHENRTTGSR